MQHKDFVPFMLGSLFLGLLLITIGYQYYFARISPDIHIAEDITRLATIFKEIHAACHILSFEHDKNYIDFLNVASFVGSEVGLMNLAHPKNWQGPYVHDNPTIQEKYYMIVRTKQGHYIVPGDGGQYCAPYEKGGVRLANGKVIGRDIIFSEDTDIESMMRDKQWLSSDKGPLAARIPVGNEQ